MARLETLLTEEQIRTRVSQLAQEIARDYGDTPLVLVGVLKGSCIFLTDLARRLGDNVTLDFVQTSSYGEGTSSSGIVQIRKDLDGTIEDKHVLIVEDIIDTGRTLAHLLELFSTRKPKSLKVVSLLVKPGKSPTGARADYEGFEIPDQFVVGYGLDYAERYRNLPYVAVLHE